MHQNTGCCLSCGKIFNAYPGFDVHLRNWFYDLQSDHPEAHVSCAGRGKISQEALFQRKASNAHYGESSHNFNVALDLFRLLDGKYDLSKEWFQTVIKPRLLKEFKWYGEDEAIFYELPHVEISNWRELAKSKLIFLVE